jgi:putative oxidoreductase
MTFPQLARFTDVALLLLRLMVGIVFLSSGYNHLKNPAARSKDIGMSTQPLL